MAPTIKVDIVTPERVILSEDIDMLVARAIDGLIGILPRHAPLVTALNPGVVKIKKDEEVQLISISEGFMEVKPAQINVVVRTAELPHEIDVERAEKARKRAEKRLESDNNSIDVARAEAALQRSIARLKAARKGEIQNTGE